MKVETVSFALAYFNPRPPRGGRPGGGYFHLVRLGFQSTPPARGATPLRSADVRRLHISIHAPREGGDRGLRRHYGAMPISIHAPREGGDMDVLTSV